MWKFISRRARWQKRHDLEPEPHFDRTEGLIFSSEPFTERYKTGVEVFGV